ncbi:MAG TPA: DUF2510 domain-containing protein [Thermoleophilaceae bacterium]|jgi:hypothetical protein
MHAADPLAEFYATTPREPSGLSGRAGVEGAVDAALEELRVPATLDEDGDWTLETDVGQLAVIADDLTGDVVAVQTLQSMDRSVEDSAEEMHALLRLNFEFRGLARFGAITQGGKHLLVITARIAGDEVSTETVQRLLADTLRLSRRLDELLGRAPAEPATASAAEPEAAEAAPAEPAPVADPDVTAFAPVPGPLPPSVGEPEVGEPGVAEQGAAEPDAAEPGVAEPAAETVFAQPVPQAPPEPEPAPVAEPAPELVAESAPVAEPAPLAEYPPPEPPAPASPEPSYPPPGAEPQQAQPTYPPPVYSPPEPELPPANWYPDPYYEARLRYWDGQQWTQHVAQ